jgi:hypothetical protein
MYNKSDFFNNAQSFNYDIDLKLKDRASPHKVR